MWCEHLKLAHVSECLSSPSLLDFWRPRAKNLRQTMTVAAGFCSFYGGYFTCHKMCNHNHDRKIVNGLCYYFIICHFIIPFVCLPACVCFVVILWAHKGGSYGFSVTMILMWLSIVQKRIPLGAGSFTWADNLVDEPNLYNLWGEMVGCHKQFVWNNNRRRRWFLCCSNRSIDCAVGRFMNFDE